MFKKPRDNYPLFPYVISPYSSQIYFLFSKSPNNMTFFLYFNTFYFFYLHKTYLFNTYLRINTFKSQFH